MGFKLPERSNGFARHTTPPPPPERKAERTACARGGDVTLTRSATAAVTGGGSSAPSGVDGASGLAPSASQPLLTQSYTAFAKEAAKRQTPTPAPYRTSGVRC